MTTLLVDGAQSLGYTELGKTMTRTQLCWRWWKVHIPAIVTILHNLSIHEYIISWIPLHPFLVYRLQPWSHPLWQLAKNHLDQVLASLTVQSHQHHLLMRVTVNTFLIQMGVVKVCLHTTKTLLCYGTLLNYKVSLHFSSQLSLPSIIKIVSKFLLKWKVSNCLQQYWLAFGWVKL